MPCIGNVPSIVASGSISQPSGGNFTATTLYTPAADGVFRISVYFDGDVAWSGNSAQATISWTDDTAARSAVFSEGSNDIIEGQNGSGSAAIQSCPIHSAANAIKLALAGNGNTSAFVAYYIVEQLS